MPTNTPSENNENIIIQKTKSWLEKIVIGLNLCPFAKSVFIKNQIRFAVTLTTSKKELGQILTSEFDLLLNLEKEKTETTLLIIPNLFPRFLDFNDYLAEAEERLGKANLEGVLQIASFHPDYQFAGRKPDDPANFVNRSPYPILHLLREESIEEVVEHYPNIDDIYPNNIQTLRNLGIEAWKSLQDEP
ncbi:MAG: DUF1415 domain-containing protein [Leptospira sp.]|nr:DUF1415 domain-containing protein [Leptospira sp.]